MDQGADGKGGVSVNTTVIIEVRRFPVRLKDGSGKLVEDTIILTKRQLQAAQLVNESSKEVIRRLYRKQGLVVVDIGKPERQSISVDLNTLWGCG